MLQRGLKITSFCNWGIQYQIEFDIEVSKRPIKQVSILQMTIGNDYFHPGKNIPMIELYSSLHLRITSSINGYPFYRNFQTEIGKRHHVEISQKVIERYQILT